MRETPAVSRVREEGTRLNLRLNREAEQRVWNIAVLMGWDMTTTVRTSLSTFEIIADHVRASPDHEVFLRFPDGSEQRLVFDSPSASLPKDASNGDRE